MNCNRPKRINKIFGSAFVRTISVLALVVLLMSFTFSVSADVGMPQADREIRKIYVVGNPDFYPIEYYNYQKRAYEGALPQVFEELSSRLGVEIEYINGYDEYSVSDSYGIEAHIFSSHIIGSDKGHIKDEVQVFSYSNKGKKIKIGLAFTERASENIIKSIKGEIEKFSPDMISGYLVTGMPDNSQKNSVDVLFLTILSIAMFLVSFVCIVKVGRQKEIMNSQRITDSETGIGNLVHFEQCYSLIPDEERHLYVVLYIIIEGSNLQTYHRDSAFNEAVRHTADLLNNYDTNGGFVARVTESGFVLVVKTDEGNGAKTVVSDICRELNFYFHQNGTERNSFFRVAAYQLSENDNSSELLIFHLRHNCNKLIGTDMQSVICDPGMTQREAEEKRMIENIITGFEKREFKLYMQFIVDKENKKIVSAEALSRWHKPDEGVISPFKYIGVMERSGLILRLDYYMFGLVCQQLHKWKDTEFDRITISCNITRITISEPDFVERIREISSKYIFDHSKLIMEITEDAIEKNRSMAMSNIARCKKMGFRIALDDMGSGYTSFMNLCEYPVDVVKIDRDILLKTDTDRGRDLFVGIIALAHSLGFTVVCEGVETEAQKCLVEETECNYIQGWYYFTPQTDRECEKLAREYQPGIKS